MPGTTQDQQAANLANMVISHASAVKAMANTVQPMMDQWNSMNIYTMLEAFPTCATNADGSLGAADQEPVNSNVMDPRVHPSQQISIAISASDVAGLATFLLQSVKAVCDGQAVAANPQVPALLAKVM